MFSVAVAVAPLESVTLTEKLLTYALGRGLDSYDMPAVRSILRDTSAHDYRFSSLVLGIVRSTPFLERIKGTDGEAQVGTAH